MILKICAFCDKRHYAKGCCQNHYRKLRRLLDPEYIRKRDREYSKKTSRACRNRENLALRIKYETDENYRKRKKQQLKDWCKKNHKKRRISNNKYFHSEKGQETRLMYRQNHPIPSSEYHPQIRKAMNLRRKIDQNKCQWFGCIKTKVEVHKIFPLSKYVQELSFLVKNLICYCAYHHLVWHQYNGDQGAVALIRNRIESR